MAEKGGLVAILEEHEPTILDEWTKLQLAAATLRRDLISEAELRRQSGDFLGLLRNAALAGRTDVAGPEWAEVRGFLQTLSRSRATLGFSPSETATFVFSLKQPLFTRLRQALAKDGDALAEQTWIATVLLDKLGLLTVEQFLRGREEVIARQQREMIELSTPVVKIWDGILALPLIGTLDSARTQVVMESLLQAIVETGSSVAIIDITGVPTVDTLVAQHLLKTVSAARLMGADCVISGIRPQIAQTMVHLGVGFADVVTKASLADAIRHAFRACGLAVGPERARA